jgi:hypothetical protein
MAKRDDLLGGKQRPPVLVQWASHVPDAAQLRAWDALWRMLLSRAPHGHHKAPGRGAPGASPTNEHGQNPQATLRRSLDENEFQGVCDGAKHKRL